MKTLLQPFIGLCIVLLSVAPVFAQMSMKAECQTKAGKTVCKRELGPAAKPSGKGTSGSNVVKGDGCTWTCAYKGGAEICETGDAKCQDKLPVHWAGWSK